MRDRDALEEARALLVASDEVHIWPDEARAKLPVSLATLRALVAELEAARAVVEAASNIRYECDSDCRPGIGEHAGRCGALLKAFKAYDAAKAGKAVE